MSQEIASLLEQVGAELVLCKSMLPTCEIKKCRELETFRAEQIAGLRRWLVRWGMLAVLIGIGSARPCFGQRTVAERYLFEALNTSRANAGLPLLAWSDRLTEAAAQHAEAMSRQDTVAHQLEQEPDLPERAAAKGVRFSSIAENIAVASTPVELHEAWVHSAGHRENMLDPSLNTVGIAVRQRGGEIWGVEDFARALSELSGSQQEARVSQLLSAAGVHDLTTGERSEMCTESPHRVEARPAFVMRFNSTDLARLPQALLTRLHRGGISRGSIVACDLPQKEAFASYSVAVALYR